MLIEKFIEKTGMFVLGRKDPKLRWAILCGISSLKIETSDFINLESATSGHWAPYKHLEIQMQSMESI
jgi:hypothetical protein